MTIRSEYARIVRRARAGYEENRREVTGAVTIGMLMVTDVPQRPRRRR